MINGSTESLKTKGRIQIWIFFMCSILEYMDSVKRATEVKQQFLSVALYFPLSNTWPSLLILCRHFFMYIFQIIYNSFYLILYLEHLNTHAASPDIVLAGSTFYFILVLKLSYCTCPVIPIFSRKTWEAFQFNETTVATSRSNLLNGMTNNLNSQGNQSLQLNSTIPYVRTQKK